MSRYTKNLTIRDSLRAKKAKGNTPGIKLVDFINYASTQGWVQTAGLHDAPETGATRRIGLNNVTDSPYSAVLAGIYNAALPMCTPASCDNPCPTIQNACYATVVNGAVNSVTGTMSTIINGTGNTVVGAHSMITNGVNNTVSGEKIVAINFDNSTFTATGTHIRDAHFPVTFNGAAINCCSGIIGKVLTAVDAAGKAAWCAADSGLFEVDAECNGIYSNMRTVASGYCSDPLSIGGYSNFVAAHAGCSTGSNNILMGIIPKSFSSHNIVINAFSCAEACGSCNIVIGQGSSSRGGQGINVVIGKGNCTFCPSTSYNTVVGGCANSIGGTFATQYSSIIGGCSSTIGASKSAMAGTVFSSIYAQNSGIMAGCNQRICSTGFGSFIGGGDNNIINGCYGTVIAGGCNTVPLNCNWTVILGMNGFTANRCCTTFVQNLSITSIPTSAAGLPAGAVWSDGGTLCIV